MLVLNRIEFFFVGSIASRRVWEFSFQDNYEDFLVKTTSDSPFMY